MFKTSEKLQKRIKEIDPYRYKVVQSLKEFKTKRDTDGSNGELPPDLFDSHEIMKIGDRWEGRDVYLWIQTDVELKKEWANEKVVGIFDFGTTDEWGNSGFEALLFIDGHPYQGIDKNHTEVIFNENYVGKKIRLSFRLWSGLEGGGIPKSQEHRLMRADIAILDQEVDELFYTGNMINETLAVLDKNDENREDLKLILNKAINLVDWTNKGSEAFYKSLHKANRLLQKEVDEMDKHSKISIYCVGHTHIDVAWLWRLRHTREKAARSFSTVLRLMENFPYYLFLQTQPQLYEYIKTDYPEIYENIKKKVKDGQWEVDGAMWVESDCNITSGESLVRQILVGSRFMKDEFDKTASFLWLPDVFGYSWALPQILRKSGLDTFMTTKISWNQYNRIPHDSFIWRGMDGTEILTHFITTPANDGNGFQSTYNGMITADSLTGEWNTYQDKKLNKDLLLCCGHGDGGGGVTRGMLESIRIADKLPGLPNVKTSTARSYFDKLHATIEDSEQYVHTWNGELYLEYHRGTYTSQGAIKRKNRELEFDYRRSEMLSVLAAFMNGNFNNYQKEDFFKGWKIILTNQFHDIIPGSSITEVYQDAKEDYAKAEKISAEIKEEAFHDIFKHERNASAMFHHSNAFMVFNDSSFNETRVITIENPNDLSGCFYDQEGNKLLTQKTSEGFKVRMPNLKALSLTSIFFQEGADAGSQESFAFDGKTLDTPYYRIENETFLN